MTNTNKVAVALRDMSFEQLVTMAEELREAMDVEPGLDTSNPDDKYVIAEVLNGWAEAYAGEASHD